jgi:hypothetical protein
MLTICGRSKYTLQQSPLSRTQILQMQQQRMQPPCRAGGLAPVPVASILNPAVYSSLRTKRTIRFRRQHRLLVRADGSNIGDQLLTSSAILLSLGGLVTTAFSYQQHQRSLPTPKGQQAPATSPFLEDEAIRWTVMGVLSCTPLFNWMVGREGTNRVTGCRSCCLLPSSDVADLRQGEILTLTRSKSRALWT